MADDTATQTDDAASAAPEPAGAQVAPAAPTPTEGTESADAVPAYWPGDWRDRFAGKDDKVRAHLNRFASPEGVFKSWRHYESQRQDGRLKPARPDTEDPAKLAEWRKAVGIPESPEGYFDHITGELPEGADRGQVGRIFNRMHALGVEPAQAKEVVAEYYRMQEEQIAAFNKRDAEFRSNAEEDLRSEWGPEYKQNIQSVGILFQQHASPELFERFDSARFADGTRVADDPGVMKFLVGLAREVTPDGHIVVSPSHGMDRGAAMDDELRNLELEMKDTRGRDPNGYWHNPGKQARYLELLSVRDRMKARGR